MFANVTILKAGANTVSLYIDYFTSGNFLSRWITLTKAKNEWEEDQGKLQYKCSSFVIIML